MLKEEKMNQSILIVEDQELFAMQLEVMLEKLGYQIAGIADNSENALAIISEKKVDLILMDIVIQGEYDGIELIGLIHQQKEIPVIFITSQTDDLSFKRASRFEPEAFMQKPFSELQLKRCLALAFNRNKDKDSELIARTPESTDKPESLFIRKKQKIIKVPFNDIFYLESDGKYSRIYTEFELFMIRLPMAAIHAQLPDQKFLKCHKSYIVNISKIKTVDLDENYLILEERKVPFSRREKSAILKKLHYI